MSKSRSNVNLYTQKDSKVTPEERWWLGLDTIIHLWSEECAQGMAEYGLILAIIVLFLLLPFTNMVNAIPSGIQPISDKLLE
ncbi:hypothetical protein Dred_2109 [Desulforamulus reducens MI-1]|uniref:Uncharacterized protein n=1 Tax=Desulforamulus reducens (strain ATCC BAA-1160 / DSM 100696 / MI-1) TaxID=349161 RepID=A4J6C3_DESRM|nr:hypothetical protein [Desulforamulus reducens]ABO50626.1 hypothetical protein Dred_2109 [Desulforamulus reducens MI-1]